MNGITIQPPVIIDYGTLLFSDRGTPYRHGPVLYNGRLYVWAVNSNIAIGTPELQVYKSENGGSAWTILDAAHSPSLANGMYSASFDNAATLYAAVTDLADSTACNLYTFSLASETWQGVYGAATSYGPITAEKLGLRVYGSIAPGKSVMVYGRHSTSFLMSPLVFKYQLNTGGVWGPEIDLGFSFTWSTIFSFAVSDIEIDSSGAAHVFLFVRTNVDTDNIWYVRIPPAGPASAPALIRSVPTQTLFFDPRAVVYRASSDEIFASVYIPAASGGPEIGVLRGTPSSNPVWAYETIYNGSILGHTDWDFATLAISQASNYAKVFAIAMGPIDEPLPPTTPDAFMAMWTFDGASWSPLSITYNELTTPPVHPNLSVGGEPFGAVVFESAGYIGIYANGLVVAASTPGGTFCNILEYLDWPVVATPPVLLASCNAPPVGQVGVAYTHTLSASGGTPPYSYAITAGSLPNGLSLNSSTGVISGTPTLAGTFNFTVTVTDAAAVTATVSCSITIVAPPPTGATVTCSITINAPARLPPKIDCQVVFYKGPAETLDFLFDWTGWLGGDAITASSWVVAFGDGLLNVATSSYTANSTTVWLSGGTDGVLYIVTNTVTTQLGRTEVRSFQLNVFLCHVSPPDPPLRATTECYRVIVESPVQSVDIQMSWRGWLSPGDTLTGSIWGAESPLQLTASSYSVESAATRVIVQGTPDMVGKSFVAFNTITTAQGRTDTRRILFDMETCGGAAAPAGPPPPPQPGGLTWDQASMLWQDASQTWQNV